MSEENQLPPDTTDRSAVVSVFQAWLQNEQIDAPTGQHVVRFCADMWVARTFPCDLGIPTVWGILSSADAFLAARK
jgi:hypothetical protein